MHTIHKELMLKCASNVRNVRIAYFCWQNVKYVARNGYELVSLCWKVRIDGIKCEKNTPDDIIKMHCPIYVHRYAYATFVFGCEKLWIFFNVQ